jgi:hypothetical protein
MTANPLLLLMDESPDCARFLGRAQLKVRMQGRMKTGACEDSKPYRPQKSK